MGVIAGEIGDGKTVAARAALATLDASRHQIIYTPPKYHHARHTRNPGPIFSRPTVLLPRPRGKPNGRLASLRKG